jgi:hypothetical protein
MWHYSLKPTRIIITLIFFQAQDLDPWQIPIKKISPTINYNRKDMQKTSVNELSLLLLWLIRVVHHDHDLLCSVNNLGEDCNVVTIAMGSIFCVTTRCNKQNFVWFATYNKMKLILESWMPKGLWNLKVHQDGVKHANSLER